MQKMVRRPVKHRIAVDLRPFLNLRTGVGKYQVSLMRAITQLTADVDYLAFNVFDWQRVTSAHYEPAPVIGDVKHSATQLLLSIRLVRKACQILRAGFYRATVPYVRPDFFHAFLYRPPSFSSLPFVPVIYDLSNKRFPQHHPIERIRWMEGLDKQISSVPVIHTISEFTAKEIVDYYGVDRQKIVVATPGVDDVFFRTASVSATMAKHDLTADLYFLCVGTLEPRKNLATLIRAYAQCPAPIQQRFPLVLAGMKGWSRATMPKEAERLIQSGSLRLLGYVSDDELRDLYASARAMFYPSMYEGFGMPIAEARAAGARIIASDIPPHHEASCGVGLFVETMNIDRWSEALSDASQSSGLSDTRGSDSLTWEVAALQTMEIYRRAGNAFNIR